jgi:hypothetical protein
MAALDFPASPTVGQTYTANGLTYTFNGVSWALASPGSPPPSFVGCVAYNAGTQSISTGVETAVTFNTELQDTGGVHSTTVNPSRFTVVVPGYYQAEFNATFSASGSGIRQLYFKINGGDFAGDGLVVVAPLAAAHQFAVTLPLRYLNAGDYVEAYVYQTSGSTLTLGHASNSQMSFMSFWKVDGVVGPAGSGTPSGVAFPASPTAGQQFFRTDLGLECYYDGTRWLTKGEYSGQMGVISSGVPPITATTSGVGQWAVDFSQAGMLVTRIVATTYMLGGTSNGSNYWTYQYVTCNAAGVETNIGPSFNTSAFAASSQEITHLPINAACPAGSKIIYGKYTKVGAPGNLYNMPTTIYFKLIVT